jgi:sugar O-acyltransferase (sialic acid O-acetyltransferase NeuD family)
MRNLIIWGSGGHGRVILDIAMAMACFDRIAFYDDNDLSGAETGGVPVLSGGIRAIRSSGFNACVIAIGSNSVRAQRFQEAIDAGLEPMSCVHPTSCISERARVGAGSVVMPRAVINSSAQIGADSIVNTGAVVEHDCIIGDHVHLSPGVLLGGNVTVHSFAHVGIGAVVLPGVEIGASSIVGAGAVVVRSVATGTTVIGVPARALGTGHSQQYWARRDLK